MNAILQHPIIEALSWAIVHSFWQGAIIAACLALAMFVLRRRSSEARYAAGCVALLLLFVAPMATAITLYEAPAKPVWVPGVPTPLPAVGCTGSNGHAT